MNDTFQYFLYIVFFLATVMFVIHLVREYTKTIDARVIDSKNVSFNEDIETKIIPGRETIEEALELTEGVVERKYIEVKKELDKYLNESDPLQKVNYAEVKDEPSVFDYKNKYLDSDYPKDTMKGYNNELGDSGSSFKTVPMKNKDDFYDATGLPVKGSTVDSDADFDNDVELTYNDWFQGKKPREYIPSDEITYPKFEKQLKNKQDYLSIGEWEYKNEQDMNTGSTGNNIKGYSSFHEDQGMFNNKIEISACHQ
jgi:hypothetical protein